jgi:hypothetical protein
VATEQENLQAARSQACAMLAWLEASGPPPAGPVRMTYSDGVRQYDWNGYRAALTSQIKELSTLIQVVGGPFEVVSVARG